MNKEKQIEEMKSIIDKAEEEYSELWNEWFYDHKEGMKIDHEFLFFAKAIYNAGYRKASEVIDEMRRRFKEKAFNPNNKFDFIIDVIDAIADELKKEYTEEGK